MQDSAPTSNLYVNIRPTSDPQDRKHGTARPFSNPHQDQHVSSSSSGYNQQLAEHEASKISQEKFASIIIDVDNRLPKSKLEDIKFLCFDKVSDQHVLEDAKSAKDVFKDMKDYGTLRKDNIGMIAELLHRVGLVKAKKDAFKGTGITWPMEGDSRVTYLDEFRCLLHDITQQLPKQKLQTLKDFYSLQETSDIEHDLDEVSDFLDLFLLLEDQELIAPDNIGLLQDFSDSVFKNQRVRDHLKNYEDNKLKEGPVLSVTEKEAEKLFRWGMVPKDGGDGKLSAGEYYGFKYYEKMATKARGKHDQEEEMIPVNRGVVPQRGSPLSFSDCEVTAGGLSLFSRGLVTPSMLKESASSGSMKADGGNSPPRHRANQRHPVDDQPTPLHSTEMMQTDNSSDDEEYLTISHDTYHRSLQIPYYKMDAKPRGICLIISNKTFPGIHGAKEREGTEKDVDNLEKMFRCFDFEIHVKRDLTGREMKDELKRWQGHNHNKYNAFVCCVLSHGNKGFVMAKDGKQVQLSEIVGYFKGSNCPSLIGKPKIFIIQACQGDDWQRMTTDRTPSSPTGGGGLGIGTMYETLPTEVDILLLLSTVPGYKSVRTKVKGSWFIMALTAIWRKYPDTEVQSVVTLLNNELSRVTNAKEKQRIVAQTAFPSSTLRKLLFFQRPVNHETP